jgi:SagB-type dehydrogenase family enzyme
MSEQSVAPSFDDFVLASEIGESDSLQFADRVRAYRPTKTLRTLTTSASDDLLPLVRVAAAFGQRRSIREFADAPVQRTHLGALLSGLALRDDATRSFPSAGGLYPLEVVAALANVSGMSRQLCVYHPDTHALGRVGDLPPWNTWGSALGSGVETEPPVTLFLLLDMTAMIDKYGERGGRFAFLEAGHAGQVIAMSVASCGLGGYALGGSLDHATRRLFGLNRLANPPVVAMAYACGVPAVADKRSSSWWRRRPGGR